ncbi:MAG: hypothetical protein ACXWC4_18900 [Telluria sp.]
MSTVLIERGSFSTAGQGPVLGESGLLNAMLDTVLLPEILIRTMLANPSKHIPAGISL